MALEERENAEAEKLGCIVIEATSIDLVPDFSRPWHENPRYGQHNGYDFAIQGVRCFLYLMGTDPEIPRLSKEEKTVYLLLARDCIGTWMCHYMLAVYVHGVIAIRGTVIALFIPEQRLDLLGHWQIDRARLILA